MRRFVALMGLAPLALALASCLSPTLPIPPPEQPDSIDMNKDGTWSVSGSCEPGAIVTVFDTNTGEGRVVEDLANSGRYTVDIDANKCDTAWVTQVIGGDTSSETFFVVMPLLEGDPTGGDCQ